jgi:mono/diheme cytochrome c family protein
MKNKRALLLGLVAALIAVVVVAAAFALVIYNGPRMKVQDKIEDFTAPLPPGDKAARAASSRILLPGEKKPPAATPDALQDGQRGAVYYRYYCLFCHGEKGAGDGPVGQSYVPVPANLQHPQLRTLSDSDLLKRMLYGTGHEPVLERVVKEQHRPYLLKYVRGLGEKNL